MSEQPDMFVDSLGAAMMEVRRKKEWGKANGYARVPGSGPKGETCKTCVHSCATGGYRKTYYKCAVIKHRWTHGPGTDILIKSPACSMWKGIEP